MFQTELSELVHKTDNQARELEHWRQKYQFVENKYAALAMRWQHNDEAIKFLDARTSNMTSKVCEMEINMNKQNCGEFVWSIDKFSDKNQAAKTGTNIAIYSDPFYTHKNGYKMCLRLNPDGFGAGRGTHLSVYFCMMRGAFDNILQWPFKHDVTVAVINQHTSLVHTSDTAKFVNFPNPVNWNKPAAERNGGIGYHKFIEIDELLNNPGLCLNDQIFIKCTVKMGK